jgi:hypothetical protein
MDEKKFLENFAKILGPGAQEELDKIEQKRLKEQKLLKSFSAALSKTADFEVKLEEENPKPKEVKLPDSFIKKLPTPQIVIETPIVDVVSFIEPTANTVSIEEKEIVEIANTDLGDFVSQAASFTSKYEKNKKKPTEAETTQKEIDKLNNTLRKEIDLIKKSISDFHRLLHLQSMKIAWGGGSSGGGEVILRGLDDVDYQSLKNESEGQVLTYDSTLKKWVASNPTGGGGGGNGYTGSIGPIGYSGSQGTTGVGYTGSSGVGYTGSKGSIGTDGYTGSIGYTGSAADNSRVINYNYVGNGSSNTFTIEGGYIPESIVVFVNGVKQIAGLDVYIDSGNTVNFVESPANNYLIDVFGFQANNIVGNGPSGPIGYTGSAGTISPTDRLVANGYQVILAPKGQLNLPSANNTENKNARIQSTANIDILSNLSFWTFDTSGVLTLPDHGKIIFNTSNPEQYIEGTMGFHIHASDSVEIEVGANSWAFGNDGNLSTPGSIIPQANGVYSLGNSSVRWESIWVGGNSVTFSDQNNTYPDQTLTVANGVFYITDSLNTKAQSNAGFRVGNFLLQNNIISLTNSTAEFFIGATLATGNLVFNRPIAVKSYDTGNTTFSVTREGKVSILTPSIPAGDIGAMSIIGSANGYYQAVTNPGGMLHITGNDNVATRVTIDSFGVNGIPAIVGRDARGTAESPTNTLANDVLIRVSGIGWTGGNNFTISGVTVAPTALEAQATENYSNTTIGSKWNFYNAPTGNITRTLTASIDTTGLTTNTANLNSIVFQSDTSQKQTVAFNKNTAVTSITTGLGLTQTATVGDIGIDSYAVLDIKGTNNQIYVANVGQVYTLSLPQNLSQNSSPTFNTITANNLVITGNTVVSNNIAIDSKILYLAYNSTGEYQIDGGGIYLGNSTQSYAVSFLYDLNNRRWDTNGAGLKTLDIVASNSSITNLRVSNTAHIGAAYEGDDYPNAIIQVDENVNSYAQIHHQNQSDGTQASTDFVAANDLADDSSYYIDMGINSSNYSNTGWTISGPNDAYLYNANGNLTVGTSTPNTTLKIHIGGTLANNEVALFNSAGLYVNGNITAVNYYGTLKGTANNTLFVGSTSAANVVSNAQLTSNLAKYALLSGATFTGNVVTNAYLTSNIFTVSSTATFNGNTTFNANVVTNANLVVNTATFTANVFIKSFGNTGITFNDSTFQNTAYIPPSFISTAFNGANVSYTSTTTAYVVPLGSDINGTRNITLGSNNTFVIGKSGKFILNYSIQYKNDGADNADVYVWMNKNNSPVEDTSTVFSIPRKKSNNDPGKLVAVTPLFFTANTGDTIQIMAASPDDTTVTMVTIPAGTTPTIPRTPAVITTINEID